MKRLQLLKDKFTVDEILKADFGLEREALRVTQEGKLALTKHPKVFGNKLMHPYITTDFSESQVEVITPSFSSVEEAYKFLETLYDLVVSEIGDELLWPQSMPCQTPKDMQIPPAEFCECIEEGKEAKAYREYLVQKYGCKKQIISGIHFNFSFSEAFLEKLWKLTSPEMAFQTFKDQTYMKLSRQYLRYRWLVVYLLGASPGAHRSYDEGCTKKSKTAISYRNSVCGYENHTPIFLDYTDVKSYVKSLRHVIEEGLLGSHKELYSAVRLKAYETKDFMSALETKGIKYIEIRSIDINPFKASGVALEDLKFMHLLMIFLLLEEESDYKNWQEEGLYNQQKIAVEGMDDVMLKKDGIEVSHKEWAYEVLGKIEDMVAVLGLGKEETLQGQYKKLEGKHIAHELRALVKEKGYTRTYLDLAKAHKEAAYKRRFIWQGHRDLELSTQILCKEAIKRGVKVEVIDAKDNFVKFQQGDHIDYVKQATKTSKDTYISVLAMENKVVTKKILEAHHLPIPSGYEFESLDEAKQFSPKLENQPIVIKPKSTNFGLGISIFPEGTNAADLEEAFEIAFRHDETVLAETFIKGKEYRFLVIEDEVVGILHRVPANVKGDGKSSIRELIEKKNLDPLRGKGYKTPLEKIPMDDGARLFLAQKQMDFETVPKEGEVVYLRENSNISTGGDSIDYTDEMHETFKNVAVESARAIGARICGVDMMIEDIHNPTKGYGIIELNFNPAIHIHCFPYQGIERNIGGKVLDLLDFKVKTC